MLLKLNILAKTKQLLLSLLTCITILAYSDESMSEESSSIKVVNDNVKRKASMLGIFGEKADKYVISSPLAGTLIKGGIPLANTKIIRRLTWSGNDTGISDHFITDNKGHFDIPIYKQQLSIGKLTEFVGTITLYIDSESDENFFYHSSKRSAEVFSDTGAVLEELVCDIAQAEALVEISRVGIFSRCKWKDMP
jgi:hypothetical protein